MKTLLKKMGDTKKGMVNTLIISSVFFALVHLGNLIWVDALSVISQVFYAFAIGMFFGAIYLRTKTLITPILLHGLMNVSGQIFDAFTSPDFIGQRDMQSSDIAQTVVQTLIMVIPFLIAALVLLRKVKPEEIEKQEMT
jgi:membrane protease YdiL (CAAX protease family)